MWGSAPNRGLRCGAEQQTLIGRRNADSNKRFRQSCPYPCAVRLQTPPLFTWEMKKNNMKKKRYIEIRWHEDYINKDGTIDWSCGAVERIVVSPKVSLPTGIELRKIVEKGLKNEDK